MEIYVNLNYRFKRSGAQEEQMKYLIQDLKLFQSYSQIMMASAMVGYYHNAYAPIEKGGSDTVQMTTFREKDRDYIDFIAFAYTKDQSVLLGNKKYDIFEAFANGGFPILVSKLGVDFVDKTKNDRTEIMKKYYSTLIKNGF